MGEADGEVGEGLGGGLGIVEDELSGDGGAPVLVRVIHALDPGVGPGGFYSLRLLDGVSPQRELVVTPHLRNGGHTAAGGGGQLVEVGLGGVFGIGQRVEVDEDRPDDMLPVLAGGDVIDGASGVVTAGPVVEHGAAHVVDQVELLRAAADVLIRRVDEVDADVVLGAGPSPGLKPVHHGVVAVLVFDGVGVDAAQQDALLLGVDDDALAQVRIGGHQLVAVPVDGEPVEGWVHRLQDEAALALARRRIRCLVGVLGVGVEAADTALHGIARLDVHAAAARAAGTRASGTRAGVSGASISAARRRHRELRRALQERAVLAPRVRRRREGRPWGWGCCGRRG